MTSMTTSADQRAMQLRRIRQISGVMKWVVTGIAFLLTATGAAFILAVLFPEPLGFLLGETLEIGDHELTIASIPLDQRLAITAIVIVVFGSSTIASWQVRQLFGHFRQTDFFSSQTLSRMVSLGWWLLILAACQFLIDPVSSVIITHHLPAGERSLEVTIDGSELLFAVFGTLIIMFGWILREAASIEEENRQFV